MKVLHMWKVDSASVGAGGGEVMSRLHSGLRKAGIDSKILCEIKTNESPHVTVIQPQSRLDSLIGRFTLRLGLKGGDLLLDALKALPDSVKRESILLTIGNSGEELSDAAGIPTVNFGYVQSDRLKAVLYSAADIFVSATRAETFGLVLLESMACGTPCVSFGIGGIPDLVPQGITGCLAEFENPSDLCRGIVQLLEDKSLRDDMSRECRTLAVKEYSLSLQVQRHIDLYRHLLKDKIARQA